ncbi:MAG: hypothetical protein J6O62_00155 [Bacilli bacterium]|nr:hypothetical protein [Bacilli bacterium]
MKKIIVFLIFFLIPINTYSTEIPVFNEYNNYYELDFKNENLDLGNFKLKMATFASYEYNIKKVYINNSIKEYYSFNNESFNDGIESLKEEYIENLKENYMYNELDNDINNAIISKVELYCEQDALTIFKKKYPKVIIKNIEN